MEGRVAAFCGGGAPSARDPCGWNPDTGAETRPHFSRIQEAGTDADAPSFQSIATKLGINASGGMIFDPCAREGPLVQMPGVCCHEDAPLSHGSSAGFIAPSEAACPQPRPPTRSGETVCSLRCVTARAHLLLPDLRKRRGAIRVETRRRHRVVELCCIWRHLPRQSETRERRAGRAGRGGRDRRHRARSGSDKTNAHGDQWVCLCVRPGTSDHFDARGRWRAHRKIYCSAFTALSCSSAVRRGASCAQQQVW